MRVQPWDVSVTVGATGAGNVDRVLQPFASSSVARSEAQDVAICHLPDDEVVGGVERERHARLR